MLRGQGYTMPEHEDFLNSERSAVIVLEAAKGERGTTSSKVAEKYDMSQPAASRVIRNLTSKNFLKKGERTKSQYYKPNYEGITDYAFSKLTQRLNDTREEKLQEHIEQLNEEELKDLKEDLKNIYASILESSGTKTSLYDLLFPSALIEIQEKHTEATEELANPESSETLKQQSNRYTDLEHLLKHYLYQKE